MQIESDIDIDTFATAHCNLPFGRETIGGALDASIDSAIFTFTIRKCLA